MPPGAVINGRTQEWQLRRDLTLGNSFLCYHPFITVVPKKKSGVSKWWWIAGTGEGCLAAGWFTSRAVVGSPCQLWGPP
jgi:hypothetical protein